MKHRVLSCLGTFLVTGSLVWPVSAAWSGTPVGVVADYSPVSAHYQVRRQPSDKPIPVRIGAVVEADDEIDLASGGSVTLYLQDGTQKRMAGPGAFRVPAVSELGGAARILRSLVGAFDVDHRTASSAISRGVGPCPASAGDAPISIPILQGEPRFRRGVRDIRLAWTGGCPPYNIGLQGAGIAQLGLGDLVRGQIRFDKLALTSGNLSIEIADATGKRASFVVGIVDEVPQPPADLAADSSGLGAIAQALWLADQDGGAWRLESIDRLSTLTQHNDPLAGKIADVLLLRGPERVLSPE